MDRRERILGYIDRQGQGLEVGPSHNPIAPKKEGFKVHILDHLDRPGLVEKYRPHGVVIENIEEVDFVWSGESFADLVGERNRYDWIIASHVIEHTPDLVGFLQECESILSPEGKLVLAVPDKRYCFDRFRPVTSLSRIIDSHESKNSIHTPGTLAEYFLNVVSQGGHITWEKGTNGGIEFIHGVEEALEKMEGARTRREYYDVHSWCFVPSSFRLILSDLFDLGMTELRETIFEPTVGCEFFLSLSRNGSGPQVSRESLSRAIDAELREY